MPEPTDKPSPDASQRRIQPFLDCVAYLLAKRWLRDQRQSEERSPQHEPGAHAESDRA